MTAGGEFNVVQFGDALVAVHGLLPGGDASAEPLAWWEPAPTLTGSKTDAETLTGMAGRSATRAMGVPHVRERPLVSGARTSVPVLRRMCRMKAFSDL